LRLSLDQGTECSTLFLGAVASEDDDVLRSVAQLRYREGACGGVPLTTLGLEVLAADSDNPTSSYAEHPDLAVSGLTFDT
jgi:hypothetical protein